MSATPVPTFHKPSEILIDQRIYLLPAVKALVTLPDTNDEVVIRWFDIVEALEKSGVDYLLVASTPPAEARRGHDWTYILDIKSRKSGVVVKLESGPAGMALAGDRLHWRVPPAEQESQVSVILSIKNSAGQQVLHNFTIAIK